MKELAVIARDDGVLAAAQPASASNNSVEDRLDVRGRARDHAQNVARRRLLLQRLGEIVGALAQLVEQPRVLDSDDGLVGEAGNQGDLLIGERANFRTVDDEGSDQLALLAHWHSDKRSRAAIPGRRARAI